jgi:hypothetical protein
VDDRVELFQLDPRIFSGKPPIDKGLIGISLGFPSQCFALQKSSAWEENVQTLPA